MKLEFLKPVSLFFNFNLIKGMLKDQKEIARSFQSK